MVREAIVAISCWLVAGTQATTIEQYNAFQFGSQSAALAKCRSLWVTNPVEYLRQANRYERLDQTNPLFGYYRRGMADFDNRWKRSGEATCGPEGLLSKFLGTDIRQSANTAGD